MQEKLQTENIEQNKLPKFEYGKGAGFSDWSKVAHSLKNTSLISTLERMEPQNGNPKLNPHHAIAIRLEELRLPIQSFISMPIKEFLETPENHLGELKDGDYYFASIIPGTHLAHEASSERLIEFVDSFHRNNSTINPEIYISHNGIPVMSGHVIVKNDKSPNTIYAEFTNGNFNAFHRGIHSPEIIARRSLEHRIKWEFRNTLKPRGENWQTDELFECNGGVKLTRAEMAERAYETIQTIPKDGDHYLPGYYEVLLEKVGKTGTRTAFIEAINQPSQTL